MTTIPTFHRSGTGPAGRRAGRVPSLPFAAIHPQRQPAIPDEGRSKKYDLVETPLFKRELTAEKAERHQEKLDSGTLRAKISKAAKYSCKNRIT